MSQVCLHPLVSSYPLDEPWMLDPKVSVSSLLKDCNKLEVTLNIVKEACSAGHRVLVFSRFVRMLDILERCINDDRGEGGAGLRVCRIDGGHSDLERQHTIARFNANNKISVCLVSTGAGGTGITLTGADRVILFDPSWNPADDMQAVDRAYRIGQKRDVIVYRMIAAGTVEEKMYEKQVRINSTGAILSRCV
ncbi:unnamed protein product [Ectocarpus sp. CCAP 1310/34]|nr:unnamed protein product [Ectocarpus sp. CCAP 1310/34]